MSLITVRVCHAVRFPAEDRTICLAKMLQIAYSLKYVFAVSRIPFHQVLRAIGESAFHNSSFPVIICIENHCSVKQQLKMAARLKDVLGEKIYTEKLEKGSQRLPSPESLQNRFLIRSKKLPPECEEDVGYVSEEDEGKEAIEAVRGCNWLLMIPLLGLVMGLPNNIMTSRRGLFWAQSAYFYSLDFDVKT